MPGDGQQHKHHVDTLARASDSVWSGWSLLGASAQPLLEPGHETSAPALGIVSSHVKGQRVMEWSVLFVTFCSLSGA